MSRQGNILDPKIRVFFSAVRDSDYKQVKKFLRDKQLDRNIRDLEDPFQPTALLVAAEKQDVEMVCLLLHAKHQTPDPNLEDKRGKRAIWWAAFFGNRELAEALLEDKKCEVNYIDKETGCSPLYRAIISNCTAVVRLIIHAGADINIRRLGYEVGAETPFIKAVQLDNYEVCELLINSLVNLQVKTDRGTTALHYAVAYGRHRIARLLLENCIKVNAKSNSGVTAMTVAIEHCDAAMVRLLLQFGYRPSRKYTWGETPLEQAIQLHAKGCALTLIRWGCRLDRRRSKKSYFSQAVEERLTDVMRFLVSVRPIECFGERWIWQKKWPLSIYRRLDIIAWLEKESATPRTLKNLCRAEIFVLLGENPSSKCDKLPLPSDLQDFLKFQEFTPETLYEEKPVDNVECPFDCRWTCQNIQCPKLDISSSSESEFEVE